MKRDFAHTASVIFEAYSQGKPIVRKTLEEEYWHDVDPEEHIFEFDRYIYAPKREDTLVVPDIPLKLISKSEYRPYSVGEVLYALEKHGWKVWYHNSVYFVQSVDSYGKIWIGDGWHKNPEQGFEELTWFDDETPYGALKNPL